MHMLNLNANISAPWLKKKKNSSQVARLINPMSFMPINNYLFLSPGSSALLENLSMHFEDIQFIFSNFEFRTNLVFANWLLLCLMNELNRRCNQNSRQSHFMYVCSERKLIEHCCWNISSTTQNVVSSIKTSFFFLFCPNDVYFLECFHFSNIVPFFVEANY